MDEIPLSEIEDLRDDFDVFFRPPAPAEAAGRPDPGAQSRKCVEYRSGDDTGSDRYDPGLVAMGIHPPLPVMGEYLVWGFRLLEILRFSGAETVRTVRLPEDSGGAIITALKLEDRRDGYSWEEKEGIGDLIEGFRLAEPEIRPIERLVQTKGSFLASLDVYRSLPPKLKAMVETGEMDLKTARTAGALSGETISRLRSLGTELSFSLRRELFVMTSEIAARDALSEKGISDLLSRLEEAADPESGDDPVAAVRRVRFPELQELESDFAVFKDRFTSGSGIDLRAPRNFEGSRFSVAFTFETDRQFDRILEALDTLRDNTDELYRLLYGPLRPDLSD